ncbi:MAG: bifunctional DNA primase/polymerase [Deltaproteobacteria bacterium]|nr:bifunctional DNA primase/polymerase [Deltaproteobacteria bacterium]
MSTYVSRAPSEAQGAVAPASPSSDQLPLWGVNDDGSCKCPRGHGCPPKSRGKHPKCAPYEPGDNLGNLTGADHGRIVIDVDVRKGDGFVELTKLPGFDAADLEKTLAVATASGGAHFYWRHPDFRVGNGKLAPNIDVRGDKCDGDGWAYVVAPGSRIVREDGTVGTHEPYEGCPTEPAPCPDWLLAALLTRGATKEKGEPVRAIDETHPDWDRRVELAIEACKTFPESRGDGEASKCLVRLAARLVIELQLPIAHACELIETFFSPRCTNDRGEPWPWDEADILRALERVAQQDDPMRRVAPAAFGEIVKVRAESSRRAPPTPPPPSHDSERIAALGSHSPEPIVTVTDEMHKAVDEGCAALAKSTAIFQREGRLIQPLKIAGAVSWAREGAAGVPTIRLVPPATLATELTRVTAWQKYDGRSKRYIRTQPPERIVAAISEAGSWPGVRVLHRIVEAPVMRVDGTILQEPGYDPATATIYDPCGVEYAKVPEAPTLEDARAALALLRQPFEEFPFASEADALVPIAVVLTSLAMGALEGANFPCFAFDANVQGTGKTLCADACSWILTGREVPKQTFPSDDKNELEKILGGAALAATPMLCLDNVNGVFGGDALEQRMTCRGTSQFRILGKTGNPSLPWRTIMLASGNGFRSTVDMRRRIVRCRLVSKVENPEERIIKRTDLRAWVCQRRAVLVGAGLTVLRAFVVAGKPPQDTGRLGNFEEWCALVAGALKWSSGVDVLDARMPEASSSDEVTEAYAQFLAASEVEGKPRTASEISRMPCWNDLIPADDRDRPKRVGMLLRKMLERPIGDRHVINGPQHPSKVATYRVVRVV